MSGPISFVSCLLLQTQVCFPLQNVCYMAKLYRFCMFGCLEKHPKFFWYYISARVFARLHFWLSDISEMHSMSKKCNRLHWSVISTCRMDRRCLSVKRHFHPFPFSVTQYHRDTHVYDEYNTWVRWNLNKKHQKAVMKRVPYVCLSISNH